MFERMLNLLPHFLFMRIQTAMKNKAAEHPKKYEIKDGPLKGRKIFTGIQAEWQKEIVEGIHDIKIFDYLKTINLESQVIFDIGANIGYHTMIFADLVGERGKVYSFEPNVFNCERIKKNLDENPDLSPRINVVNLAVSDKSGETSFFFSNSVDFGESSGSHIAGAQIPSLSVCYKDFQQTIVKTTTIDDFIELNDNLSVKVLKIDVEGAEDKVLKGCRYTIQKLSPCFIIEVHSIYNMYQAIEFFRDFDYSFEILNIENDGRCMVITRPKSMIE
jgi:FkbM family methyltransferase